MGILVKNGILPDGIAVSNVYMCFRGEVVYVTPARKPKFIIDCNYRVYSTEDKNNISYDIRVPIQAWTDDISQGVYSYLYSKLTSVYPDSTNLL